MPKTQPEITKEQIEDLREYNWTREQIADHFGISLSRLKRLISSMDVKKKVVKTNKVKEVKKPNKGQKLPTNYGMTRLDIAKAVLGDRFKEDKIRGCYLLDGVPTNINKILDAADVSLDSVK